MSKKRESPRRNLSDGGDGGWVVRFEPKNAGQREAASLYPSSDLMYLLGGAGVGKTRASLALALQEIQTGAKKHLYLVRPTVEATRSLGHLPGELSEKLSPFLAPALSLISKCGFRIPIDTILKPVSLAHSRGETFDDCVVVVDEAQNFTLREHILLISRLGRNARMLFAGDPDQADIRPTQPDFETDLDFIVDRLFDKPGVSVIEFDATETLRHPKLHIYLKALQR